MNLQAIDILIPIIILLILLFLLFLNSWIFKRFESISTHGNITKRTISFFLVLIGVLVIILFLPFKQEITKLEIIKFYGLVISAAIALSSTNILGNLIAGIMNNSMNRFRNGDLINIGEYQGRVTIKNIFHTEIQLEDSNLITIPNLYIASNPVKLTRKTNTVISTSVSLGYDVPRIIVEEALKKAALASGLTDPFVYIMKLGDFSVVYKIHGFLNDNKHFFSTQSKLNGEVMDILHEKGIEIVSPNFMNQRNVDVTRFIPKHVEEKQSTAKVSSPEELIFDEALKSEKNESKKDLIMQLEKNNNVLKEKLKGLEDKNEIEAIKNSMNRNNELIDKLEKNIKDHADDNKKK